MKKLFFLILIIFGSLAQSYSQAELWGVTAYGGTDDGGILYTNNLEGNNFQLKHSFDKVAGQNPQLTTLCEASNHKFYGLTSVGGANNAGVLFVYDPFLKYYEVLFEFGPAPAGIVPQGSLMEASNGKLYGYTSVGGTNNLGTLFEFDPQTNLLETKYNFSSSFGSNPISLLIEANDGFFYGTTRTGGANSLGVIFKFNPDNNTYEVIHDFDGTTGAGPIGSLLQADNGKLYGMTAIGGPANFGVIFEYDLINSTYGMLYDFSGIDGRVPYSQLIQTANGKLYGTTAFGGVNDLGVIFEYSYQDNSFQVLFDMESSSGAYPVGAIFEAANNKIYGMCREGGDNSIGVIYSFYIPGLQYTNEHSFETSEGKNPMGGITMHSNGLLYGLTLEGGGMDFGSCFNFDHFNNIFEKQFDFGEFSFGNQPMGSLYNYNNEKIYGVTFMGGTSNYGIIYEYDIATEIFSKKFDFDLSMGAMPASGFTEVNGVLYGTAIYGGSNDYGVLYKYNFIDNTVEILYNFNIGVGALPYSSVIFDGDHKLYGTTITGGSNTLGVLYEYDLLSPGYNKLIDFDGVNTGHSPINGLYLTDENVIYGHTNGGGLNDKGIIYKYDITSTTFDNIFDFGGVNGEKPFGNFALGQDGKLYGTTDEGGTANKGIFFNLNLTTNTFTKIKDFDGVNHSESSNGLLLASNGLLYGLTVKGGACNCGVIYTYNSGSNAFEVIFDYDAGPGSMPVFTTLLEICHLPEIVTQPTDVEAEPGAIILVSLVATGDVLEYKWYHNGVEIPDSNYDNLYFEPIESSDAGEYYCEVIGSCGSVFSETITITITDGIPSHLSNKIKCYPNPVSNLLHINFTTTPSNTNISISNTQGQLFFSKEFLQEKMIEIPMADIPSGIYILKVESGGEYYVSKIVKY